MITILKRTFMATGQYILAAAIFIPLILGSIGLILSITWLSGLFVVAIIELVGVVLVLTILQTARSYY